MTRREEIARVIAAAIWSPQPDMSGDIWRRMPAPRERCCLDAADAILSLPAQEPSELVERLTEPADDGVPIHVCRTMDEAASALTDQAAEIERLKDWIEKVRELSPIMRLLEKAEVERDDYKRKLDDALKALEPVLIDAEHSRMVREYRAALTEGK